MPTRYLKPGIRDSEAIDRVSCQAEVLFYRLLVTVDDFGRADARPAMIKAACFPIKDSVTPAICRQLLDELRVAGLIRAYEVDGKPYLELTKWDNPPRSKESKFPAPAQTDAQPMRADVGDVRGDAAQEWADEGDASTDADGLHTDVCNPRTLLPGTGTVTGTVTENRKPRTENREPEPRTATNTVPAGVQAPPAGRRRTADPPITLEAWRAYASAFIGRYGCDPVRNATVNAQMAQFVKRLGADEAPMVAAFFPTHNGAHYVRQGHSVGAMLRDAEKLRTEWATQRQITSTAATLADRTQTNFDAFAPLLAKARAEAANAH